MIPSMLVRDDNLTIYSFHLFGVEIVSSSNKSIAILVVPSFDFYLRESRQLAHCQDLAPRAGGVVSAPNTCVLGVPASSRVASVGTMGPMWSSSQEIEFRSLQSDVESRAGRGDSDGLDGDGDTPRPKCLEFGLFVLSHDRDTQAVQDNPQAAGIELDAQSLECESLFLGSDGTLFSPQEMFGFSAPLVQPDAADGLARSGASAPDALSDERDCIVCLTEQKEVLLLPCRYITITNITFVHIVEIL